MEDNKEIVEWLSHMNSDGGSLPFSNTTLERHQQQFEDCKQQISWKMNAPSENPNLNHLRNAIAETNAEDATLAIELSELINKLQLNPQTLANDIKENLHKVSSVLKYNGLSDADETALIITMDEKRIGEKKKSLKNRDFRNKYETLSNGRSVLERRLNYLEENVGLIRNSIEENEVDYKNEYSSYKLLSAKLVEYNATADAIEADIDSLNLKELEPDKILYKYERFMERKGELAEINEALIPYSNLPPNLLQAKALLESKEQEYNEISKKISNMT